MPSRRGWSRDLIEYDRQPILLCARVLNHCFEQITASGPVAQRRVDTWTELFTSLNLWFTNRPQDFKPVLELDSPGGLFPLILFTKSAALLANQMYHTAMLLMLQHRPRTIRFDTLPAGSTSPLRHAQRVCGISLNNDCRNTWDFCLVASFYLAARGMTYLPQQSIICDKIDNLCAETGWHISSLKSRLRETWEPA
jgi:hypothetical protein